jgi:hypothetical protein
VPKPKPKGSEPAPDLRPVKNRTPDARPVKTRGPRHHDKDGNPAPAPKTEDRPLPPASEWCQSTDAWVWADRWLETIAAHPDIPTDRETMMGWFANAIMAGHDWAMRKSEPAPDPDADALPPLEGDDTERDADQP